MKPIVADKPISELKPVDVKCSDTNCEQGFHFYTSNKAPKGGKLGDCKECGDDSIDWDRIHKQNPNDVNYTFQSLKKELLRHVCWVNNIDERAIQRAKQRGILRIKQRAKEIIRKKIGHPAKTRWDNMCTPKQGTEIIHYAQHATATCCRKCLKRWHNVPLDVDLTDSQIEFCVGLIEQFVEDKIKKSSDSIEVKK